MLHAVVFSIHCSVYMNIPRSSAVHRDDNSMKCYLESLQLEKLFRAELECQRMFTSCAWFFDDLDRIEPRNAVIYAAHAVWLTRQATGIDIFTEVSPVFEKSKSWRINLSALDLFKEAMHRFEQTQKSR